MANDEPGFMIGLFYSNQDIAKNLTKVGFAQNLKNGSDMYEHALIEIVLSRGPEAFKKQSSSWQ